MPAIARLKHPQHGEKDAYTPAEVEDDKKNGWVVVTEEETPSDAPPPPPFGLVTPTSQEMDELTEKVKEEQAKLDALKHQVKGETTKLGNLKTQVKEEQAKLDAIKAQQTPPAGGAPDIANIIAGQQGNT